MPSCFHGPATNRNLEAGYAAKDVSSEYRILQRTQAKERLGGPRVWLELTLLVLILCVLSALFALLMSKSRTIDPRAYISMSGAGVASEGSTTAVGPSPLSGWESEQSGALISPGEPLWLYAVGSSNLVWIPWLEQLHLLLQRLGYELPLLPTKSPVARTSPRKLPMCDDTSEFQHLHTSRIGLPGWGSWGFAYEAEDAGCRANGSRLIAGHSVRCSPAWGCPEEAEPLPLSGIVEDAIHSNVTVLSVWINDSKQYLTSNVCYNNENVSREDTAEISIETMRRIISAIHARNPAVWIVVLGGYADGGADLAVELKNVEVSEATNAAVQRGLHDMPNTVFASYTFPVGLEMYQTLHPGHPNCRGGKLMANSVVDALFEARVLGRGIGGTEETCKSSALCGDLVNETPCCVRSPTCQLAAVDAKLGEHACIPYSPGWGVSTA